MSSGLLVGRHPAAERGVEFVGLALARGHGVGESRAEIEGRFNVVAREPQPQLDLAARRDREAIARRHFRARAARD